MSNILLKRGTSANFTSINLKAGEPAFVTDLGKFYIGNGTQKILINPIEKPVSINVSNYFTKVKVNEYGQVVAQSTLTAADIPNIQTSQVTGLGTSAITNTGVNPGNVPVLDSTGKLPQSVIPTTASPYVFMYFTGTSGTLVAPNKFVPLNTIFTGGGTTFTAETGVITINETGLYLISYNITSSSLQMSTGLSYDTSALWSGTAVRTSTTAIPSYVTASATIIRNVTLTPEKFSIKNAGATDITLLSGYGSLSAVKLK